MTAKITAPDPLWVRRIAVTAAAVAALGIVAVRALAGPVGAQELTAASIGVALVFGMITALQNALSDRRRTTVDLLAAFSTSDALARSDAYVARSLAQGIHIDEHIDADLDTHLVHLLDYYEFLCSAARMGSVDRATLRKLRLHSMALLYSSSTEYLEARRRVFGPQLYSCMEWFIFDHCRGSVDRPAPPVSLTNVDGSPR